MSGRHSFRAFTQAEKERPEEETAEQTVEATEEPELTEPAEEATSSDDVTPEAEETPEESPEPDPEPARTIAWSRVLVFAVIPAVALLLAAGSAFLKWQIAWNAESDTARTESVQAAKDITVEMLSYEPDTVEAHLNEALNRLTGNFRDSYTALVNTRVVPVATTQRVTANADVPAIGVESASPDRVELVLFVNQLVAVGDQAPQKTTSTVRATMVREDGQWLMSEFEPVKP